MLDPKSIGAAIRALRESRGLSIRQACRRAEEETGTRIRSATVSRWENGQQLPMVDSLGLFLRGLDSDYGDFQEAIEAQGAEPGTSVLSELRRLTERLEVVTDRLERET